MSLRSESIKAYRSLYRAATRASADCDLHNQLGLQHYVALRFGSAAAHNRQRLLQTLDKLDQVGGSEQRKHSPSPKAQRQLVRHRRSVLRQYETFISQRIDQTREAAHALSLAASSEPLVSFLQVLSAGIGNDAYKQSIESHFFSYFKFEQKRSERAEVSAEATSERQNRVMQQAILPYGERLLFVHRTAIGQHNPASTLLYLSPWQVTEAIVGTRSGATAHHLQLGRDHVVVEIDEVYNKQVIYIACTRGEGMDSGSYDWKQEVERLEISESDEVRRTIFHGEFLIMGTRLCDAILHETPLHPTRKTVVVGHAVGGAVSVVVSLLLLQRGYEISNVISFGSPKAIQGTLERYVSAINPIRVVLAGDPLVELPVSGAEGAPFAHVGEILVLSPSVSGEKAAHRTTGRPPFPPPTTSDGAPVVEDTAQFPETSAESLNEWLSEECTVKDGAPSMRHEDDEASFAARDAEGTILEEVNAEDDTREFERESRVEERYREHFLIEHYIQHLTDPTVELTYAEGDDVWDDGDYADMRRGSEMHSPPGEGTAPH